MKLTHGFLISALAAGTAVAATNNTPVVANIQAQVNNAQAPKTAAANAALNSSNNTLSVQSKAPQPKSQSAIHAGSAPAPAVKADNGIHLQAKAAAVSGNAVVPAASQGKNGAVNSVSGKSPAGNAAAAAQATSDKPTQVAVQDSKSAEKDGPKQYNFSGQRDPFISPVVSHSGNGGSGCSTGKRCLAIDQINVRGVVKSEGGMIAVVTNALDKAYFLRENDPVFNGYVVKITGDSVVFKESFEDKLGKPLVREVTKRVAAPAV